MDTLHFFTNGETAANFASSWLQFHTPTDMGEIVNKKMLLFLSIVQGHTPCAKYQHMTPMPHRQT